MVLAATADLVGRAVSTGGAVLAFNVVMLEHAEAIVQGAEKADAAVLLQVSENAVRYHHGRMAPLLMACRALAEDTSVPVAINLDHFQDDMLTREGIAMAARLDVSSIMVDAAHLGYADNVRATATLASLAHDAGIFVEAELGEIGGKDGAHAPGVRTDPDEAVEFAASTSVDGLAVAVGSSHAMTSRDATLDLELITRLADRLDVPLVLHGSSGVPDAMIRDAVTAGIRKVNIGTGLNVAFTREVRRHLQANETVTDPRKYLADGRAAIADLVAHLCDVVPR